jgi:hypothetical protein
VNGPIAPDRDATGASSLERFFKAWQVVRICPDQIEPPETDLSFNPLTLAISIAIFYLARRSVAVDSSSLALNVLANAITTGIMFGCGFVYIVLAPGGNAIEKSKKWGTFFVMTWLVSLVALIVFCAIPFWMGHDSVTDWIIDRLFGSVDYHLRDVLSAAILSFIAVLSMLLKSQIMDCSFRPWTLCAIVTSSLAFAVNVFLLEFFIYGHAF